MDLQMSGVTEDFKKDRRYEFWRWRIFGITWLAYAGFYLTRASFSVAKIGIGGDPNISMTTEQMGLIDGIYLAAYAAGQFLWGALGDRIGTRRIVLLGLLGSITAGLAMGVSSIVLAFGVFSLVQGLSQATGWAPLAKNISNWFSLRERGVVMGWWATNYTIGGMVGAPLAGFMAFYFGGWRFAFFLPALVLAIILVLFFLLQKNQPEDLGFPSIEEYHGESECETKQDKKRDVGPEEGSWKPVLEAIKNPMVLLLGAVYFFLKPARYAILFWGPLFINESLGTGMAESALVSSSFFWAGPFSVLAAGYASDKLFQSRRMPYSIISMLLLAVLLFFFNDLASVHSRIVTAGLLFLVGFLIFGPDSLVSATAAIDFGTRKGASTASGFINGLGSIGAIAGGMIPGFVKDSWGWEGIFRFLAASVLLAGLLMMPKWNALPNTPAREE
jgi:OPA family sugar phosphate sensor protein UhpC-like MFS transporter